MCMSTLLIKVSLMKVVFIRPFLVGAFFFIFILTPSSCSLLRTKQSIDQQQTGNQVFKDMDDLDGLSPYNRLAALISRTEVLQLQTQQDLQNLYVPWNQLSATTGPREEQEKILKESLSKTKQTLMELAKLIEKVRIEGETYYNDQESEALLLKEQKKQSDLYRKILKDRRKFRLLYLSLQEAALQSGAVYKNLRVEWQKKTISPTTPLTGSQKFLGDLERIEKKIKQFQLHAKSFPQNPTP
jgi:hypothetical protein